MYLNDQGGCFEDILIMDNKNKFKSVVVNFYYSIVLEFCDNYYFFLLINL